MREEEGRVQIGEHTYLGNHCRFLGRDNQPITIGKWCQIGDEVLLLSGSEHDTHLVSTFPFSEQLHWEANTETVYSRGPIVVGNDVWIASRATVLSGVTIGHGAVVGAGALVRDDVDPYAIVAGVPARVVRKRFDDATIGRLLKIAWWDWPDSRVQAYAGLLSGQVEDLLAELE